MSESEEENFCFFGKPLEPYDEDSFPKKKPISVEEQIATDAQGRRRFHGAFTGGFSAGFYNTVGSLEGWTPREFKSTRQEKASNRVQRPEDFMDDEDIGEHGIAPQTVRATSDYSTSKKRRRQAFSDGPIPGEPVLHSLLTSGNETIGYLLLKNIGIKDKINLQNEEVDNTETKVYGCQMPKNVEIPKNVKVKQYEIPGIYKEYLANPKANTFGLGYEGLNKSHINLFQSTKLVVKDKNNKKLSITGQAFGVGAFEDDDEDIYVKEDMTRYDFELTSEKKAKISKTPAKTLIFDKFVQSLAPLLNKKLYLPPTIPRSFTGKHKIKKSRFEPIKEEVQVEVSRQVINPAVRAELLGEESNKTYTPSKEINNSSKTAVRTTPDNSSRNTVEDVVKSENTEPNLLSTLLFDRFVSASQPEDISNILAPVERLQTEHGTQEMRDAARMKMFGRLTRVSEEWHPNPLLCKRFNVPEPFLDKSDSQKNRKRTKNLIFEYQKHDDDGGNLKPGLSIQLKDEPDPGDDNQASEVSGQPQITTSAMEQAEVDSNQLTTTIVPTVDNPEENISEDVQADLQPKDITDKVDVEKKVDLFRAVFLSSSESEDENDEPEENNKNTEEEKNERQEELKSSVLSDPLLPKIKPMKEGILSNVDFFKFIKPSKKTESEDIEPVADDNVSSSVEETDHSSYGPKLPENLPASTSDSKITVVSSDEDEWIEKGKKSKKKNKHKKKQKKEKHSKKDSKKHTKKRK